MSKPNDGGPAFPRSASTDEHNQPCNMYCDQTGMTLRQYYAGQAIIGAAEGPYDPEGASAYAVELADALIAELEKERPK